MGVWGESPAPQPFLFLFRDERESILHATGQLLATGRGDAIYKPSEYKASGMMIGVCASIACKEIQGGFRPPSGAARHLPLEGKAFGGRLC